MTPGTEPPPATISLDDDPARIDLDAVWAYLGTHAYWGRWRSRDDVARQLASAWRVVGCYDTSGGTGQLVGFARAVSDGVALAWLADVYVLPSHRGRGLGRALLAAMIEDGPGRDFQWLLRTADAHSLYAGLGFTRPGADVMVRPARVEPDGTSWDARVAAVWAGAGARDESAVLADVLALVDERVAERGEDDAAARFELASAFDFAGRESEAEPHYRAALSDELADGLDAERRTQAVIQLASTVRNLGRPDETLALLGGDAPVAGHRDAATAFRALALTDLGRPREAVGALIDALAGHLPAYGRALRSYAGELPPDVELRPVTDDAAIAALEAVATTRADPDDVTPPLGHGWGEARLEWLRRYHRDRVDGLAAPAAELAWAVVHDGRVCGGARLRHLGAGRYGTGLWLARDARGRGLGSAVLRSVLELARTLGAREVSATTTPGNEPAVALLRRAGFTVTPGSGSMTGVVLLR